MRKWVLRLLFGLCFFIEVDANPLKKSCDEYIGFFGGAGLLSPSEFSQLGTAFYIQPIAVNAFGNSREKTDWFLGIQTGHLFEPAALNKLEDYFIQPALEIEGLYIGRQNIEGDEIVNTSVDREHIFKVTYPTSVGLGLINAVASFENSRHQNWQPFVGVGFGLAAVSIQNANAKQVTPLEQGINHYNTDPNDTDTTLASQIKAGLSCKIKTNLQIFGEYRYLYLSSSDYTFGSTYYPLKHVSTTNWTVKFAAQHYQLGAIGLRFKF